MIQPVSTAPRPLPSILDLDLPGLRADLAAFGVPAYRANQIFVWIYKRNCFDFKEMTDLPTSLRDRLAAHWSLEEMSPDEAHEADDRSATKCSFRLADGRVIESVFLRLPRKETICFSTQVGCALQCSFCVTALMGRLRNLTPGEIVGQITSLSHRYVERPQGFNLVAMGMGEPLDNYDNLVRAIRILNEPLGLNIGAKRLTVSTSGIVPMIDRLAEERVPAGLAVSLNATTDEVRNVLMPINRKYPIKVLLDAARRHAHAIGRRVTLEYVLLRGVNDSAEDARRLLRLSASLPSKINLIPFNTSPHHDYAPPTPEETARFQAHLQSAGKQVTVRTRRGGDIYAACGQLGLNQAR